MCCAGIVERWWSMFCNESLDRCDALLCVVISKTNPTNQPNESGIYYVCTLYFKDSSYVGDLVEKVAYYQGDFSTLFVNYLTNMLNDSYYQGDLNQPDFDDSQTEIPEFDDVLYDGL
jgi:hypothetical protein